MASCLLPLHHPCSALQSISPANPNASSFHEFTSGTAPRLLLTALSLSPSHICFPPIAPRFRSLPSYIDIWRRRFEIRRSRRVVGSRHPQRRLRQEQRPVLARAFSPRGGGGGRGGGAGGGGGGGWIRGVLNLVGAGLLTYATLGILGNLDWLFDAVLFAGITFIVYLWFSETLAVKGACPNCGNEFQVFEFGKKELHLCPYCSQPFKLEDRKFVREGPRFSSQQSNSSKQRADAFDQQFYSPKEKESSGMVVDIEAEVRDKD